MKKILLLLVLTIVSASRAAEWCIGVSATGSGSGADWNNQRARSSIPSNGFVRGDTYYLAKGAYGTFSITAIPGTATITIKKATAEAHGPSAGWSDALGNGPVDFTNISIACSYVVFDGVIGQWSPDLPGHVPYGFRVFKSTGSPSDIRVLLPQTDPMTTNITLAHMEVYQTGGWAHSQDGINIVSKNAKVQYCWIHDVGRVCIWSQYADYLLAEYCVIEKNGVAAMNGVAISGEIEHSELIANWGVPGRFGASPGPIGMVYRYNVIRSQRSTGGFMIMDCLNAVFDLYGNIWGGDLGVPGGNYNANGILNGLDPNQTRNPTVRVFNNTFVNIDHGAIILTAGAWGNPVLVENNLFYNCVNYGGNQLVVGGTRKNNWYYKSGTQNEPGIQNGTGDPFVNLGAKNYRLAAATNPGTNLGPPFNVDADGNLRTDWDRGAFEFGGVPVPTPSPTPPAVVIAAPVMNPAPGQHPGTQLRIYINSATSDATIYYTLDQSTPNIGSPSFPNGGSFILIGDAAVKTVAIKGSDTSVVTEGFYSFTGAPTPTPQPTSTPTPTPEPTPEPTPSPPQVHWKDIIDKPETFPAAPHIHPVPAQQTDPNSNE